MGENKNHNSKLDLFLSNQYTAQKLLLLLLSFLKTFASHIEVNKISNIEVRAKISNISDIEVYNKIS